MCCDVVNMDTCYLLFERSWKYDKAIIHDETKNMYSFMVDKSQIDVATLPKRQGQNLHKGPVNPLQQSKS
jgi:hypothetical protein